MQAINQILFHLNNLPSLDCSKHIIISQRRRPHSLGRTQLHLNGIIHQSAPCSRVACNTALEVAIVFLQIGRLAFKAVETAFGFGNEVRAVAVVVRTSAPIKYV